MSVWPPVSETVAGSGKDRARKLIALEILSRTEFVTGGGLSGSQEEGMNVRDYMRSGHCPQQLGRGEMDMTCL